MPKPSLRWYQYRLRSLLALVTFVCIALGLAKTWLRAPIATGLPNWFSSEMMHSTPAGPWLVQWEEEADLVRCIAFVHNGKAQPQALIATKGAPPNRVVTLVVPGKPNAPLPATANVFELIDGKFRQERIDASADQARRFCNSSRAEYTIDSLKEYVKSK